MRHNIIYRVPYLQIFFLFLIHPTYTNSEKNTPEHVWITIFVHGIMSVAPHLNFKNIARFACDDIVDTVYARTVNNMRKDPFFYTNQAMDAFGIQQLNPYDLLTDKASNAIARIYDEVTQLVFPEQHQNYYYTYGWSGLLSARQRYQEAEGLLIAIHQLVQKYTVHGVKPKVRLIGYSHGGNLCLNIAAIHHNRYPTMDITINELILLGMPVQFETDYLVHYHIFEKIYHIYSSVDRIQPIDVFSYNRFFSGRTFTTRRHFKLPRNLTQINVKVNHLRSKKYKDTDWYKKAATNFRIKSNIGGQRRLWRDISPGHIELWFLGWTTSKYRSNFPLNPLPVLSIVPFMISQLQKYDIQQAKPVIFDIRPEVELALIKKQCRNDIHIVPFISIQELNRLKEYAYMVQPGLYNKKLYREHIQQALHEARKVYQQIREAALLCIPRKRIRRYRRDRKACAVDRSYHFDITAE